MPHCKLGHKLFATLQSGELGIIKSSSAREITTVGVVHATTKQVHYIRAANARGTMPPPPLPFDRGRDSAIRAIRAKLLNPMVIWRITRRSNSPARSCVVRSTAVSTRRGGCSRCRGFKKGLALRRPPTYLHTYPPAYSRPGAGMLCAHATAHINIPLQRAIHPRETSAGAAQGCVGGASGLCMRRTRGQPRVRGLFTCVIISYGRQTRHVEPCRAWFSPPSRVSQRWNFMERDGRPSRVTMHTCYYSCCGDNVYACVHARVCSFLTRAAFVSCRGMRIYDEERARRVFLLLGSESQNRALDRARLILRRSLSADFYRKRWLIVSRGFSPVCDR